MYNRVHQPQLVEEKMMVRMIPINTTMNNNHVFIGETLTSIDELKRQLERESSNNYGEKV